MKDKTKFDYWCNQSFSFELSTAYASLHQAQLSRVQCWNRGKEAAKAKCQEQKAELIMNHDAALKQVNDEMKLLEENLILAETARSLVHKEHEQYKEGVMETDDYAEAEIVNLTADVAALKRTIAILMAGE